MDYDELASACKESDTKIQSLEAEVSQLKKDLTAAKSSIKTVCGELNTTSVDLLASKISILEEMLKSKFEYVFILWQFHPCEHFYVSVDFRNFLLLHFLMCIIV